MDYSTQPSHSAIGVKIGNVYKFVLCYCAHEIHAASILPFFYNSYEKAFELIKGGDIARLGKSIDATSYYAASQAEADSHVITEIERPVRNFWARNSAYLFENGQWFINKFDGDGWRHLING